MQTDISQRLRKGVLDLDMDAALDSAKAAADTGDPKAVLEAVEAVTDALHTVGKRFQEGEWFLGELVYAGEISREVMDRLSPLMDAGAAESAGTVVVGTVAGDLHDIGKNIFVNYARSAGFNVVDLGIDVPAQRFVDAVRENSPLALGMSCLLTTTSDEIGRVIDALRKGNLRDRVRIVIGGAARTRQFADGIGADAFAPDAVTGTDIIKGWSGA